MQPCGICQSAGGSLENHQHLRHRRQRESQGDKRAERCNAARDGQRRLSPPNAARQQRKRAALYIFFFKNYLFLSSATTPPRSELSPALCKAVLAIKTLSLGTRKESPGGKGFSRQFAAETGMGVQEKKLFFSPRI